MLTHTLAETVTLEALLEIPVDEPERLFTRESFKAEYRTLAGRWYAAARSDKAASDVMGHLNVLYQCAKFKFAAGDWERPNVRIFRPLNGEKIEIPYRAKRIFELGELLIGDNNIAYLIDPSHRDLFERAKATVSAFAFADAAMKAVIEPHLPKPDVTFEIAPAAGRPGALVMIIHKTPDLLSLADVLAHVGNEMDPKHVAWVMTRLHDFACWLFWSNNHHNDISLETVFISPKFHTVAVLGGWWYATKGDEALYALPARTVNAIPADVLRSKVSDRRIDQDLIRTLGRELLSPTASPNPMSNWLRTASAGDALMDYFQWGSVRDKTFGKRKFIPLDITADHLYSKS
jgi:hypothetical protein